MQYMYLRKSKMEINIIDKDSGLCTMEMQRSINVIQVAWIYSGAEHELLLHLLRLGKLCLFSWIFIFIHSRNHKSWFENTGRWPAFFSLYTSSLAFPAPREGKFSRKCQKDIEIQRRFLAGFQEEYHTLWEDANLQMK